MVVEAKPKSGTMITVDFALEQGRDVFAIPGNIDSVNSMGTNELIRQGAKLVTTPEEIIEEYKNYNNTMNWDIETYWNIKKYYLGHYHKIIIKYIKK